MDSDRFHPDLLIERACDKTGLEDFGDSTSWRDGLDRVCDGLAWPLPSRGSTSSGWRSR